MSSNRGSFVCKNHNFCEWETRFASRSANVVDNANNESTLINTSTFLSVENLKFPCKFLKMDTLFKKFESTHHKFPTFVAPLRSNANANWCGPSGGKARPRWVSIVIATLWTQLYTQNLHFFPQTLLLIFLGEISKFPPPNCFRGYSIAETSRVRIAAEITFHQSVVTRVWSRLVILAHEILVGNSAKDARAKS